MAMRQFITNQIGPVRSPLSAKWIRGRRGLVVWSSP